MKIAVLGAGALGSYYGARLAMAGHDVTFIMRSAYEKTLAHGLHITSSYGAIDLPHPKLCRTSQDCGPVDLVLICWKSTANEQLAHALPPLTHEMTQVVTLQNGMGNAEMIEPYVEAHRIFIGLCTICAMMPEPGQVIHTGPHIVRFASYRPSPQGFAQAKNLCSMFREANVKSDAVEYAEQAQWLKLTWNIPYNGLCLALGGISVGELYQMPQEVDRARQVMQEVALAACLRGFPITQEFIDKQIETTATMGPFIPSSALDYLHQRPVEYQSIWGLPLQKALEVNTPVKHWLKLNDEIRTRLKI